MSSHNGHTSDRFGALVRVSTEKQEQQGESLRTQRKSNERDVERLGGTIVEWYGGQEHATPGWEHAEVDRLLLDAAKKRFDAVIVAYADRWSRDNAKSKEGLDILRKHGIRFFIGASEMDLFDPQVRFVLGMHAEVGEFISLQQSKKSLENRIERARRGIPSSGSNPYGRKWDKKANQWSVDQAKKAQIAEIAQRYLAGEGLDKLAAVFGWTESNLRVVLRERCGDTWLIRFQSDKLNIDETVAVSVPRLLDQTLIQKMLDRMDANRTYLHGKPKRPYLLGGYVFCAACGYNLVGEYVGNCGNVVKRYYRHSSPARHKCPCKPQPYVPADKIEEEVVSQLFDMFGNPAAITRAIKASVPDCEQSLKRRNKLAADLDGVKKARQNVLTLVGKGLTTMEEAESQLKGLQERVNVLQVELDRLDRALADVPTEQQVKVYVERIEMAMHPDHPSIALVDDDGNEYAGGNSIGSWLAMTTADKKRLIDAVFSGPLVDGKPAGVYVSQGAGIKYRPKPWQYTIRGRMDFELVMQTCRPIPPG
ncbi:MAG TPA: recombinase family protein [Gemmataceae bacterium]|jgi:DNA invertase Pin-like site-specific DNA recombinase